MKLTGKPIGKPTGALNGTAKPTGRPRAEEKRDHQLNVALTAREYALVKEKADAVGLRMIDYARAALLRRRVAVEAVAAVSTLDRLGHQALCRIGANLNQLVRRAHITGTTPPGELAELLRDIRARLAEADRHDP